MANNKKFNGEIMEILYREILEDIKTEKQRVEKEKANVLKEKKRRNRKM